MKTINQNIKREVRIMTRLEEHDLKMARDRASNNLKRIDILLTVVNKLATYPLNAQIIAEYRRLAKLV